MDGVYFGQLNERFHFSKVRIGVFTRDRCWDVFGRTDRVVLDSNGVKVVLFF